MASRALHAATNATKSGHPWKERHVKRQQFDQTQRTQALELIESLAWGDISCAIYSLEVALALALEAVGGDMNLWEAEGEERFRDEFELSSEQVASLDDEWRRAYIARLLQTAVNSYGVGPGASPGRSPEGITSPIAWNDDSSSVARLVRGLNDILYGVTPPERVCS
jgi:hypothetical protein